MTDIILDVDSVGDDMLAILYSILNPKINVLGITAVNGACGSLQQAVWVAMNMVELTGRDIPVYGGADEMLAPSGEEVDGDPVNFDEALRWKFGDRLDGFNIPAKRPEKEPEAMAAWDYMIQTIQDRPGEITVVTTGPLTNLAIALKKEPELAAKIKRAYVLGGVFQVPGNVTPVTEYNIWADPEAARIVMDSDIPDIVLVPLDVCETNRFADSMMTRDHLADLEAEGSGPVVDFIVEKFPIYIDIWREFFQLGGFPMDDVITVALSADESFCKYTPPTHVDVELEGKLTRGETVAFFGKQIVKNPMENHKNVRIANWVDGKRFMNQFVKIITEK